MVETTKGWAGVAAELRANAVAVVSPPAVGTPNLLLPALPPLAATVAEGAFSDVVVSTSRSASARYALASAGPATTPAADSHNLVHEEIAVEKVPKADVRVDVLEGQGVARAPCGEDILV